MKKSCLLSLMFVFVLFVGMVHADSSDGTDADGTKRTYYWEGAQINNLGRLGGSSTFEDEQRRNQEGKNQDQYLASIREQMARQSKSNGQTKALLTFQGQLPKNVIERTYLSPGVRVTLHAEMLFDENTTTMKTGAVDTLQQLRRILETEQQKPLQFVVADTLDDMPRSKDIDAQRSLVVLGLLQMPPANADQENLTPEKLSR